MGLCIANMAYASTRYNRLPLNEYRSKLLFVGCNRKTPLAGVLHVLSRVRYFRINTRRLFRSISNAVWQCGKTMNRYVVCTMTSCPNLQVMRSFPRILSPFHFQCALRLNRESSSFRVNRQHIGNRMQSIDLHHRRPVNAHPSP